MSLSEAIVGSNHTGQRITWKDERGNPVDLTGSTLTAGKREHDGTTVTAVDGPLDLVSSVADNNQFDWTYGTNDIATAGTYVIQFFATYASDSSIEINMLEQFIVHPALVIP